MDLEDKGLRIFEDSTEKLRTKLIADKCKSVSKVSVVRGDGRETDADLFFFDNKGNAVEDEEMQPADDTAFLAAAQVMKSLASNGRKRKDLGGEETPVKCIKFKANDSSMKRYAAADGMSSGSEIDDPPSDDEMEEN